MADRPEGFDEAWAGIVEELTSGRVARPDHEEGSGGPAHDAAAQSAEESGPDAAAPAPPPSGDATASPGLAALFEPLRRAEPEPVEQPDPGAFVDNWADEGHFTPPPPPELPRGTPIKRLGWAGMIGGPSALALLVLTGWDAPTIVWLGAGLATLAGFITLVWLMPDSREDGWDDGARL